jgi:beta-galactosidase
MFISYLLCILLPFCYAGIFSVDYGNYRFLKDGKPFRYIAAEIHYFRIHPDLWEDRLQKVRAAGLNAVSVYMPWNLHEPTQGK